MALSRFEDTPITTMLEELGQSPGLTLIVGAGASAEAGLPPWRALVRDLLDRAGRERLELADPDARTLWIEQIMGGESPLGAAAVAEALADDDLAQWIPEALYGDDPQRFQPGPIARQIPVLRAAFGTSLRLLTTNYDDLVQQAFDDDGSTVDAQAFTGPHGSPAPQTDEHHQRISHLHGFLARDGRSEGTVVLTEEDYQRVAQADWQRSEVGYALMNGPCVFIGSSLTDPNLLRYLHVHAGAGTPRHYAIFTRQDAYAQATPPEVIAAREQALAARWRSSNLEITFVDHYAEIALALAEIARAKRDGTDYRPLPSRLADWHDRVEEALLLPPGDGAFRGAQDLLHGAMRIALEVAVDTVRSLDYDPGDEVLGATLWLVARDGDSLTSWAMTDRVHRDPATLEPVPITEHSHWVGVRAFCRGAALGEPRDVYASRWRYIRGLPLVNRDGLPVGVLTVASMRTEAETMLDRMPDHIEAAFDEALRQVALDILDLAFEEP
jgi:hypothetical protein